MQENRPREEEHGRRVVRLVLGALDLELLGNRRCHQEEYRDGQPLEPWRREQDARTAGDHRADENAGDVDACHAREISHGPQAARAAAGRTSAPRRASSADNAGRASNKGPAVTRTIQGPASKVSTSIGPATQVMIRSAASNSDWKRPEAIGDKPRANQSAPASSTRLSRTKAQPAERAAATWPSASSGRSTVARW